MRTPLLIGVAALLGIVVLRQTGLWDPFEQPADPFGGGASVVAVTETPEPAGQKIVAQAETPAAQDADSVAPIPPPAPVAGRFGNRADQPAVVPMATKAPEPAADAPVVDESALRYFASRGDSRRLEAEIARLQALYPQWTPPDDPMAAPPQGDAELDRMWRLYSEGRIAEVRKAIADRETREPAWEVPEDLLIRLALAEARETLVNASEIEQNDTVIRVAAANPAMLTCGDVDVLWRVAEAFARTDRERRAVDAYLYILRNCTQPEERIATVQKAMSLLPREALSELLATEQTIDGKGEFEAIRSEVARQGLIDAATDTTVAASPADLALVEKLAEDAGLVSDYLLLGWHYLHADRPKVAEEWFARARAKESSADASQGLGLSLIGQDRPVEAEAILYEWRETDDKSRDAYLAAVANMFAMQPPPAVSADVLNRAVAVVAAAKDAASAQQLGWYADGFNQFKTAERWFQTALSWQPDNEPSAYGLALMRWKLGNSAGVREVQSAWVGRSERIPTVGQPSEETASLGGNAPTLAPAPGIAQTPAEGQSTISASAAPQGERQQSQRSAGSGAKGKRVGAVGCTTTMDPEGLSPDAALRRGWCLMDRNRPIEAAKAFEVALKGGKQTRSDAAYGQSLAYLRVGMNDMAAVSASKAQLNPARSVEIETALLSAQATSAYGRGRYVETLIALDARARIAPERNDLLVLRGYSYLNLARYGDAERVFRAAAATGNHDAMRGLNDLWAARNPGSNPY